MKEAAVTDVLKENVRALIRGATNSYDDPGEFLDHIIKVMGNDWWSQISANYQAEMSNIYKLSKILPIVQEMTAFYVPAVYTYLAWVGQLCLEGRHDQCDSMSE